MLHLRCDKEKASSAWKQTRKPSTRREGGFVLWEDAVLWAHFNTVGFTVILPNGLEPEAH